MRMALGNLRDPVVILRLKDAATKDGVGIVDRNDPNNWELYASRRAQVFETGGREVISWRKLTATAGHIVRFRNDVKTREITAGMRITLGNGQTLEVSGIARDIDQVEVTCETVV